MMKTSTIARKHQRAKSRVAVLKGHLRAAEREADALGRRLGKGPKKKRRKAKKRKAKKKRAKKK